MPTSLASACVNVVARFSAEALLPEIRLNQHSCRLLCALHGAETVRDAIAQLAEVYGEPLADTHDKVLPAVREALRMGMLEVR